MEEDEIEVHGSEPQEADESGERAGDSPAEIIDIEDDENIRDEESSNASMDHCWSLKVARRWSKCRLY